MKKRYPDAIDPSRVGSYPRTVFSGGGYFYDDVLEYRVWFKKSNGKADYKAFSTFTEAEDFSNKTPNAETPLVLIYQKEHINEPSPGYFEHIKEPRITEWQVVWLNGNQGSSEQIMANSKRFSYRGWGGGNKSREARPPSI